MIKKLIILAVAVVMSFCFIGASSNQTALSPLPTEQRIESIIATLVNCEIVYSFADIYEVNVANLMTYVACVAGKYYPKSTEQINISPYQLLSKKDIIDIIRAEFNVTEYTFYTRNYPDISMLANLTGQHSVFGYAITNKVFNGDETDVMVDILRNEILLTKVKYTFKTESDTVYLMSGEVII